LDSDVAVVEKGHGPPVVLVHGALGDHRQWHAISEQLAPQHRVLAVSRRYHWPNPPPSQHALYSYESHRDDLLDLLRSFTDPVHLVGHSYGAGVTLLAALAEPARVRSLALLEPALASVVSGAAPGFEPEVVSRATMVAAIQAFVRARQDERASEALVDWLQGGEGGFNRLPEPVKQRLLANAATIGPTFVSPAPNVTCDQLRHLLVPTLVASGALTRLWFRRVSEAMVACIPGAQAAEIPGCRHMVIVENPEATAALLLPFLLRH
jgi:pimeloyl-ACP methyl ester carboxylesterase